MNIMLWQSWQLTQLMHATCQGHTTDLANIDESLYAASLLQVNPNF